MEYKLRWGILAINAVTDEKGLLFFECPFCGQATSMQPSMFRISGAEVRTLGMVICELPGCSVPYELQHSAFLPWQPSELDHWMFYRREFLPGRAPGLHGRPLKGAHARGEKSPDAACGDHAHGLLVLRGPRR